MESGNVESEKVQPEVARESESGTVPGRWSIWRRRSWHVLPLILAIVAVAVSVSLLGEARSNASWKASAATWQQRQANAVSQLAVDEQKTEALSTWANTLQSQKASDSQQNQASLQALRTQLSETANDADAVTAALDSCISANDNFESDLLAAESAGDLSGMSALLNQVTSICSAAKGAESKLQVDLLGDGVVPTGGSASPVLSPPANVTQIPASSGLSNNNTYVNSDGQTIHSPADSTNGEVPPGATAQCVDGTYSFSTSRSGTCSYHGGVAEWL